ncbi:Hypothetical predicted protein [Pelobates cultripes]|uniref:Uncharacterized protein n=1 Tax=Pelobates cultripes TaxID=61616 RepID=A0AAD1R8T0_PELCU|nr:Hypothetical predicted protein [Pelobates cultripes]
MATKILNTAAQVYLFFRKGAFSGVWQYPIGNRGGIQYFSSISPAPDSESYMEDNEIERIILDHDIGSPHSNSHSRSGLCAVPPTYLTLYVFGLCPVSNQARPQPGADSSFPPLEELSLDGSESLVRMTQPAPGSE